ncbi:hypothetical protein FLAN108750_07575 [Flavobacterium antarcticum]
MSHLRILFLNAIIIVNNNCTSILYKSKFSEENFASPYMLTIKMPNMDILGIYSKKKTKYFCR